MAESLPAKEIIEYPNGGKSYFYVMNQTAVIIDEDICACSSEDDVFPYTLITDKQNEYMHRYEKVFRFLAEDADGIEAFIRKSNERMDMDFIVRAANRDDGADASPLELLFEKKFTNVYGMDSLKYLCREYGIVDNEGRNHFLDYYVRSGDSGIAVEENGVTYHHPQIIGKDRYRRQLHKQNTCTQWGIKLFRFSTEDCQYENRIEDDIRTFFGENLQKFEENGLLVDRKVQLYDHQAETLENMAQQRANGVKTFLIVFPTASGKSKIVETDMQNFAETRPGFKALILAPNKDIILDWERRVAESLPGLESQIEIRTFAYMVKNYAGIHPKTYDYIVIDDYEIIGLSQEAA